MIIGIDISQIVYGTGVSRYTKELIKNLLLIDWDNQYKLFAGVFRQRKAVEEFLKELPTKHNNYTPYIKLFPPRFADIAWNHWHNYPIEDFLGRVDLFHSSNWALPPTRHVPSCA